MIFKKITTILIILIFHKFSIAQNNIEILVNQNSNNITIYNASLLSKDAPVIMKKSQNIYNFTNLLETTFVLKTTDSKQIPYLFSVGRKYSMQLDNNQNIFIDVISKQKNTYTNIISNTLKRCKNNPLIYNTSDTLKFSTIQQCLENYKKRIDTFSVIYNQIKSENKNQSFIISDKYITASIDFVTLQYIYSYLSSQKGEYSVIKINNILYEIHNRLNNYASFEYYEMTLASHLYLKIQFLLSKREISLLNLYNSVDSFFKNINSVYLLKYIYLKSIQKDSKDNFNLLSSQLEISKIASPIKEIFDNLFLLKKLESSDLLNYNGLSNIDTLQKFKNKLVYIDIWASWCIPCIEQFQYSNKLYKNYDSSKLKIIYLSFDNDINSWKKASFNYNIPIKSSFFVINNFNSEFAKKFKITTIPRYLLIGKDGKIILEDAPRPSDSKLKILIDKYIN